MYNSPCLKVRTLTLASALLIFGSGLNVLYADNDRCRKDPKCPGQAKRVKRRERRVTKTVSRPHQDVAKNVTKGSKVLKKGGEKIFVPSQPATPLVVRNQSSFAPSTTLSVPTTTLPQQLRLDTNLLSSTVDFDNTIASTPGNSTEEALQHGYYLIANRKHKEASKQFQAILTNSPFESRAYDGLGDVHMAKGRHSKAVEAYRKALELAPQNTSLANKLQEAIAIEKEQDKVNRNRKWGIFLKIIAGAAIEATKSHP